MNSSVCVQTGKYIYLLHAHVCECQARAEKQKSGRVSVGACKVLMKPSTKHKTNGPISNGVDPTPY